MRAFVLILTLLFAPPAAAQEEYEVREYGGILRACYEDAEGSDAKSQCLGAMSTACMEQEEGGYTTLGMSRCAYGESLVWDEFLNAEYRETRRFLASLDEEDKEYFPEFSVRVEALLKAQRAWIAYRDASCELDYALWGAGSMRHISGTQCAMETVSARTIELIRMREVFQ